MRELRRSCDPAQVLIQTGDSETPLRGTIFDVSSSGLRVRVNECLSVGSPVHFDLNNSMVSGTIRYCRRIEDAIFDVGVQITEFSAK